MPEDVKSRIAELEKELYSKDYKPSISGDVFVRKEQAPAPAWDTEKDAGTFLEDKAQIEKKHKTMKKFVKLSILFFVLALCVSGFIWWRGANIVSGENIDIDISAPTSVAGGDTFDTKFVITNNNKVVVEEAVLRIEYPLGFYLMPNKTELPRIAKDLGMITPKQFVSESIETALYGEENVDKEVLVTLEYKMAGSNATLKKTKSYIVKVSTSPVNVKLQITKEASSGQEIDFVFDIGSNSNKQIDNLLIKAEYPFGFNFKSSDPSPSYGNNSWKISKLSPQEKRTIKIHGIIEGQENEEKVTKISVGTQSVKEEKVIGLVYNTTTESTIITKPFIGLELSVNNEKTQEYTATLGRDVKVDIFWKNNSNNKITDAVFEAKLSGEALNRYSLYASNNGFYRSIDDTIVWTKISTPELASMEPNASGYLSFRFSPIALSLESGASMKNPQISFEVRAVANRTSENGRLEDISTFATGKVKFGTDIRLSAKTLYYTGAFKNTGPVPPKSEKETTYTVVMSLRNSSNSISNGIVKTILPIYVKWQGQTAPAGENISYNENTSEVSWVIPKIPVKGTREASFQVSIVPSISQIGQAPQLTGDMFFVGTDDFTKAEVSSRKSAVTTSFSTESRFVNGGETVVR